LLALLVLIACMACNSGGPIIIQVVQGTEIRFRPADEKTERTGIIVIKAHDPDGAADISRVEIIDKDTGVFFYVPSNQFAIVPAEGSFVILLRGLRNLQAKMSGQCTLRMFDRSGAVVEASFEYPAESLSSSVSLPKIERLDDGIIISGKGNLYISSSNLEGGRYGLQEIAPGKHSWQTTIPQGVDPKSTILYLQAWDAAGPAFIKSGPW